MKIFLKKCLLFLFFLSFFYPGCVFLWGSVLPSNLTENLNYKLGAGGHLNSRVRDLRTFGNVDVLFLGSSHTYRGFDPRFFEKHNIKIFNLGSSAQTPIQTEVLLARYLKSLNPKLVVFEVYPGVLSIDGVESALDLIANDRIDFLTIRMALDLNQVKVYNTLIYGMIRDLLDLHVDFIEPVQNGKDRYVKGGFVEREFSHFKSNRTYDIRKWELISYQKIALERILKKLRQMKINVILVQAPISRELYDSYSNNSEINSYLESLGEYHNFNDILQLPTATYFYDSDHLNQDGVEVFNKSLIDLLRQRKYLLNEP